MILEISRNEILASMTRFDNELRKKPEWIGWQKNRAEKYAIQNAGLLYPVKQIVSMATGMNVDTFSGGVEANNYILKRNFNIIPLSQDENTPTTNPMTQNEGSLNDNSLSMDQDNSFDETLEKWIKGFNPEVPL